LWGLEPTSRRDAHPSSPPFGAGMMCCLRWQRMDRRHLVALDIRFATIEGLDEL